MMVPGIPASRGGRREPDGAHGCRPTAAAHAPAGGHVLVIDGDLLVADAIVSALTQMTFDASFAMPATPTHVRDLAAMRPGLVLIDVDTIDHNDCIELVSLLAEAKVPVAVMSSRVDMPVIGESIVAGATSVVNKSWALDDLASVITRLFAGGVVLDEEAKRRILEPIRRQAQARRERLAPFDALTYVEKSVLAQLLDGHAPETIARNRSVSILTVRSQIKAILQKLGVNSQLAAVSLALRAGWTVEERHTAPERPQAPANSVPAPNPRAPAGVPAPAGGLDATA